MPTFLGQLPLLRVKPSVGVNHRLQALHLPLQFFCPSQRSPAPPSPPCSTLPPKGLQEGEGWNYSRAAGDDRISMMLNCWDLPPDRHTSTSTGQTLNQPWKEMRPTPQTPWHHQGSSKPIPCRSPWAALTRPFFSGVCASEGPVGRNLLSGPTDGRRWAKALPGSP